MRTVILVGLIYVGDHVGKITYSREATAFVATIVVCAIFMDIIDFAFRRK